MFTKKYNFKNYLWVIPFLSFLLGYFTIQRIFQPKSFNTPAIVGKQLQEAISILSKNQLNIKFILEKEDPDLPHGTILSQKPVPGLKITPNQCVYVTISKKPNRSACPELFNKNIHDISNILKSKNLRTKSFYINSDLPINSCVAQYPLPECSIKNTCIITYISKGNKKPVIFPNLKNLNLSTVLDFLKKNNITTEIIYTDKPELSKRELKKQEAQILQETQQIQEPTKTTESSQINPEQTTQTQNSQDLQTSQTQVQNSQEAQQSPETQFTQENQEELQDLTILDQRPLAGSLIILDQSKPITVHLKVLKK